MELMKGRVKFNKGRVLLGENGWKWMEVLLCKQFIHLRALVCMGECDCFGYNCAINSISLLGMALYLRFVQYASNACLGNIIGICDECGLSV